LFNLAFAGPSSGPPGESLAAFFAGLLKSFPMENKQVSYVEVQIAMEAWNSPYQKGVLIRAADVWLLCMRGAARISLVALPPNESSRRPIWMVREISGEGAVPLNLQGSAVRTKPTCRLLDYEVLPKWRKRASRLEKKSAKQQLNPKRDESSAFESWALLTSLL
jgi:hypothetical protein